MGTALFITGEIGTDRPVHPDEVYLYYLKDMRVIPKPVEGCIISWEVGNENLLVMSKFLRKEKPETLINHIGVVTSVDPLKVTYRRGSANRRGGGNFLENMLFSDIPYNGRFDLQRFYMPRELEVIYGKK